MNSTDVVIILIVVAAVAVAGVRLVGTATGKRDCCSGDLKDPGSSKAGDFSETVIEDADPANYPFVAELGIGGMSCEHCVKAVTNALDSVEGTWAEVTLAGGRAVVRSKREIDEAALREAVEKAGYRVVSFGKKQ